MRQQYKHQSFAAWAFWLTLVAGGTLYGASHFDWFDLAWLHGSAAPPAVTQGSAGDASTHPLPPDGRIEVSASPVGPQSEPPPEADDTPLAAKSDSMESAKARLMVQRAEETAPKLRANQRTPSTVEPASIDEVDMSHPKFSMPADPSAAAPPQKPTIQPVAGQIEPPPTQTESPAAAPAFPEVVPPASKNTEDSTPAAPVVAAPPETPAVDPELASRLKTIDGFLEADDMLRAHRELSTIYWSKPGWRSAIQQRIERTANAIYFDSRVHFVEPYIVVANDQIAQIAKQYNLQWQYLAKLNRIDDPRKLRPGRKLKVIQGPFSAIVESDSFLLTIHAYGYFVRAYPIGVGKDSTTPLGKLAVLNKVVKPQYTDPHGRVIDPDDPQNPLGPRWLDLGNSYGIHGTIDPTSIGKAESRGCIRMRNPDVIEVFDMLGVGSEVTIRP
jgi:lipoprotein-anchoring transpeptidase ErfK/SrfK